MLIHGLQKMTLLDYPSKVACTIFTAGCNFRCPFCHNAALVTDIESADRIDENEILEFLKDRRGKLDGVCITGGEPMLNSDIAEFIGKIKDMGYPVKLDTNGSFPEKLLDVIEKGLVDYVAMDIKNSKSKYALTAGIPSAEVEKIDRSIKILLDGKVGYEFRTTVTDELHTVEDVEKIGEWIKGADKYYIQSFVDSGALVGGISLSAPPYEKLKNMRDAAAINVKNASLRGV